MRLRNGFIGLLFLVFGLAFTSLIILVYDDRKDLSSRATDWLTSTQQSPLTINTKKAESFFIPQSPVWDSSSTEKIYYHTALPVTVRILDRVLATTEISTLLGPDFSPLKPITKDDQKFPGWQTTAYSTNFLGQNLISRTLLSDSGGSLLVVYPPDIDRSDLNQFLSEYHLYTQVKGAATPDDSAKLATLVRPSIVMVVNRYCAELKFLEVPDFSLSGKEYPFCLSMSGTGFFVNKEGYVATNGHVVKNQPLTTIYLAASSGLLDPLLSDFLEFYLTQSGSKAITKQEITSRVTQSRSSKEATYQYAGLIANMYDKHYLSFQDESNSYFLQLGNNNISLSDSGIKTTDDVVAAKLVDFNYKEPVKDEGFVSSDVAILKVESNLKYFPALPLGKIDDAVVGSDLQVVGFPGAASSAQSLVVDTTVISEPTFTRGVVSAIKDAKGDGKKLIQTDAAINHGNSGGPALTANGQVVGISTYTIKATEGGGNYNFLRDIQDLKDLMEKNSIDNDTGEVYTLWKQGLENYWLSYFRYSSDAFTRILDFYPPHPMANKYLKESNQKMGSVEDLTPRFTRETRSKLIAMSGWVMGLSLLGIVTLFVYNYLEKRRQSYNHLDQAPHF